MERNRGIEVKVGLFVAMGIALLVVTFVMLGSEQNMFESNYTLNARFSDISGLRAGASVRLSGMDVGLVRGIEFPKNLEERHVFVELRVAERFRERIRGDSVATIESQGLLGDKYVAVSLGTNERATLEHGSWIDAKDPVELMGFVDEAGEIVDNIKSITKQIDDLLKGPDGQTAGKDVMEMLASIKTTIVAIEKGNGIAHRLIYDPSAGRNLASALANIDDATVSIAAIAKEIRSGEGGLHQLVYGDKVTNLLASLSGAGAKIETLIGEVQTGNGVLHELVYTESGKNLLANLTDASADIREVVAGIKRGEGTLGGILIDPTIYQDVKSLLGKAQRNQVLKAFVRDNLRRSEQKEGLDGPNLRED